MKKWRKAIRKMARRRSWNQFREMLFNLKRRSVKAYWIVEIMAIIIPCCMGSYDACIWVPSVVEVYMVVLLIMLYYVHKEEIQNELIRFSPANS